MSQYRVFSYSCLLSLMLWLLPFLVRILFIDISYLKDDIEVQSTEDKLFNGAQQAIQYISQGEDYNAFVVIFKNNLKGCALNVLGGVSLGMTTIFNLFYNGFLLGDILSTCNDMKIINKILPHSFELIGLWLSGGIGLYVSWGILQFMRGKDKGFTKLSYGIIGIGILTVFLVILSAAYVEVYISTKISVLI